MATISVIIPAYNQADYVDSAIQSVLDQTFSDFELVVVDDGSTDHTQSVLANFENNQLQTIRQENGGLLAARNTGLALTTAPFVTFLDADDLFLPNRLSSMHAYLEQHPNVGMLVGGTQFIDQEGRILGTSVSGPSSLKASQILLDNPITVSGVLIRRKWIEKVGGFESRRHFDPCGDWDLWLRVATAGCQIDWLDQLIVAYRVHPNQMTRNWNQMRTSMMAVLDKFFGQDDLSSELVSLKNQAYAAILVKSAARSYHAGMIEVGNSDLIAAIEIDPTLKDEGYRELVKRLVGWAHAPHSNDPEGYLVSIKSELPASLNEITPTLDRAISEATLKRLFEGTSQIRRAGKWALIKVIQKDPSLMRSRGVIRLLAEAWLPLISEIK